MIRSFRAGNVAFSIYHGLRDGAWKRFPHDLRRVAARKINHLAAAGTLEDLKVPPGNRLERLRGDLAGYYSIRINERWRLMFRWDGDGAEDVFIADYH